MCAHNMAVQCSGMYLYIIFFLSLILNQTKQLLMEVQYDVIYGKKGKKACQRFMVCVTKIDYTLFKDAYKDTRNHGHGRLLKAENNLVLTALPPQNSDHELTIYMRHILCASVAGIYAARKHKNRIIQAHMLCFYRNFGGYLWSFIHIPTSKQTMTCTFIFYASSLVASNI